MNRKTRYRLAFLVLGTVFVVLIVDELWMFGVPIGPILPNLSKWHISPFHHWMLGALGLVGMFIVLKKRKKEMI